MSEPDRQAAVTRYQNARRRYVAIINDLMTARKNAHHSYQPDWLEPWPEFDDGINRVYPRKETPWLDHVVSEGSLRFLANTDPELWFQIVLQTESIRFANEAGLGEIIRMP